MGRYTIEINNRTKLKIPKKLIFRAILTALRYFKVKTAEISIAAVVSAEVRKLNKQRRRQDKPTDIISFRLNRQPLEGELVICYSYIKNEAKRAKIGVEKALSLIIIHGILHLLGYTHGRSMEKHQIEIYNELERKKQC